MYKDSLSIARWALPMAVNRITYRSRLRNRLLNEYYLQVNKKTSSGKMEYVSTMKKLVRIIHHMLRNGERRRYKNIP